MRIVVLASGRGSNFQAIVDAWEQGELPELEIAAVISDQPGAKVLDRARSKGIAAKVLPVHEFSSRQEYDRALVKEIENSGADFIVLAGFMRLLGQEFISRFTHRVINIHPSLLPAFPGLDAQQQAWKYGVKVSGCTVHFVDAGMDTGPIIAQAVVSVLEDDTAESLAQRILQEEHSLYPAALKLIAQGRVTVKGRRVFVTE